MAREYPWYEIVSGQDLEQGNLLFGVDVPVPATNLSAPLAPDETEVLIHTFDLVVMTQSCDLEQGNLTDVVVCPHWDIEDAEKLDPKLRSKGALIEIAKGRRPRYRLLERSTLDDPTMGVRIVDFGRVYSLPLGYLKQLLQDQTERLRLCSPYREYLAQAFGNFFMRVGLPRGIDLPR